MCCFCFTLHTSHFAVEYMDFCLQSCSSHCDCASCKTLVQQWNDGCWLSRTVEVHFRIKEQVILQSATV